MTRRAGSGLREGAWPLKENTPSNTLPSQPRRPRGQRLSELWSDKVKQTPDASRSEVKKILTEIEEELGRAESMKAALHTAMFGA